MQQTHVRHLPTFLLTLSAFFVLRRNESFFLGLQRCAALQTMVLEAQ